MEKIIREELLTMLAITTRRFVMTSIDGEEHANLLQSRQSDEDIQRGWELVQKLTLARFVNKIVF